MLCAKFGRNSSSGEEDFLNFVNVFSLFRNYLLLEKEGALHLNKIEWSPLLKDDFCFKFGWNWPSGSGEEDFLIPLMYFRYSVIISPWTRGEPFIWTNLNDPLYVRMHRAKFGWLWPCGSDKEDFLNFVNVFSLFRNYLPFEKGGGPSFE